MHFGEPSQRQREAYTLVLKGNISLAMAVFPEGIDNVMWFLFTIHLYYSHLCFASVLYLCLLLYYT